MKKKHADIIKKWAEGEVVQRYFDTTGEWMNDLQPSFNNNYKYRIQPTKKNTRKEWLWIIKVENKTLLTGGFFANKDELKKALPDVVVIKKANWSEEVLEEEWRSIGSEIVYDHDSFNDEPVRQLFDLGLPRLTHQALKDVGIQTVRHLQRLVDLDGEEGLRQIKGIGTHKAKKIIEELTNYNLTKKIFKKEK